MGGEKSEDRSWLADAIFELSEVTGHKTSVDADLAQGEVLQRVAGMTDRQKIQFVELVASRGRELFAATGADVTGVKIPVGVQYLFPRSVIDMILAVAKATEGTEPHCDYCLERVDLEDVENACRQATLWVSGPKSQNTRQRTYTGAYAHRSCVEARIAKQDDTQEELQL